MESYIKYIIQYAELIRKNPRRINKLQKNWLFPTNKINFIIDSLSDEESKNLIDKIGLKNLIYLESKIESLDKTWICMSEKYGIKLKSLDLNFPELTHELINYLSEEEVEISRIKFYNEFLKDKLNAGKLVKRLSKSLIHYLEENRSDFYLKKPYQNKTLIIQPIRNSSHFE